MEEQKNEKKKIKAHLRICEHAKKEKKISTTASNKLSQCESID